MGIADQRILLFDLGKAIFPSRPRLGCAAVSSGGQGWAPLGGHPKGLSLTAASTVAGFCSAGERPSKTVLSAPSESVILLNNSTRALNNATRIDRSRNNMSRWFCSRTLNRRSRSCMSPFSDGVSPSGGYVAFMACAFRAFYGRAFHPADGQGRP